MTGAVIVPVLLGAAAAVVIAVRIVQVGDEMMTRLLAGTRCAEPHPTRSRG